MEEVLVYLNENINVTLTYISYYNFRLKKTKTKLNLKKT